MNWLYLAAGQAAESFWSKEHLIRLIADHSYVGVFLFLLACGLGFPCPEEVSLIGGGWAVYRAHGNGQDAIPYVALMVAVAMTGVLVGDALLWYIGRRVGNNAERLPLIGRHLTPARMAQARLNFAKHGAKAVFFGRFLFGVRAVTFFVSGSLHVPLGTFLIMDGLAALLSVPISIILAWHFGSDLEDAINYVGRLDKALLVTVSIIALIVVGVWLRKRRAAEAQLEAELAAKGITTRELADPALPSAVLPALQAPAATGKDDAATP